jgi:uncharacterized coiled-coil DUF342 family protein
LQITDEKVVLLAKELIESRAKVDSINKDLKKLKDSIKPLVERQDEIVSQLGVRFLDLESESFD